MLDHILALADALKTYYSQEELATMVDYFKIDAEQDHYGVKHMPLAKLLLTKPEVGRNKEFLTTLLSSLGNRVDEAIANTDWEKREFHRSMWPRVSPLLEIMKDSAIKTEVTVKPNNPFSAKAEVRELISNATTPIIVVDNYIGLGTLDSLRTASQPIRLLTGTHATSIEKDFSRHAKELASEGHPIEVRCHPKLHDRYIIFNNRCWILGSSIKDSGKKIFSMIELADTAEIVIKDVEQKWKEGTPLAT